MSEQTDSIVSRSPMATLFDLLVRFFSKSELVTLSFSLGLDYERFDGAGGKDDLARELILTALRHGQIGDLLQRCREERPLVSWPLAEEIAAAHGFHSGYAQVSYMARTVPSGAISGASPPVKLCW